MRIGPLLDAGRSLRGKLDAPLTNIFAQKKPIRGRRIARFDAHPHHLIRRACTSNRFLSLVVPYVESSMHHESILDAVPYVESIDDATLTKHLRGKI